MADRPAPLARLLVSLVGAVFLSAAPPMESQDPVLSITAAELRHHVFFLASDELEGRDTGSRGYDIAATYAITQFRSGGLMPAISGANGKPSYEQQVPLVSYLVGKRSALTVRTASGTLTFLHPDDMVLFLDAPGSERLQEAALAFVGYGIDDPEAGWSDYRGVDVRGKAVLAMAGTPRRGGKPVFPPEKEATYRNLFSSVNDKIRWAADRGVAALILVADREVAAAWRGQIVDRVIRRQFGYRGELGGTAQGLRIYFLRPEAASRVLDAASVSFADGDADYRPRVLPGFGVSGTVEREDAREMTGRNVVALLPGTDPVLRDEYIVVDAHLDHLGLRGDGVPRNGADDDASGCAVVLEVAEALALKPARRSYLFALFTAEERGILGSAWFLAHSPIPRGRIVLNAAADMLGRRSEGKPDVIFVTSGTPDRERLSQAVARAMASGSDVAVDLLTDEADLQGCDTRPFLLRGIPSLLFSRGWLPPFYHSPDDDAETLDYHKITGAGRLIYRVLHDLGNR